MPVTINCDMGEGFALYRIGNDAAIMPFVDLANVACGFHASDPSIMRQTVRLAKQHGVKVGAHPSLPDLQGFGRRRMNVTPEEVTDFVTYQIGALNAFLVAEGMRLNHVKPHGALYGMAARDEKVAHAIAAAATVFKVPLYGMGGTLHEKIYVGAGIPFVSEFYVDLDYSSDGALIITREHEAVDPQAAAAKALRALEEGKVRSLQGPDVVVRAECICVHSDTPGAVDVAKAVREAVGEYLH